MIADFNSSIDPKMKSDQLKERITEYLRGVYGVNVENASRLQKYKAVATCVRRDVMELWANSKDEIMDRGGKRVYYLSMEFLPGRLLGNNVMNLGLMSEYHEACRELGIDFEDVREAEADPGLGNGGLGRLAACFLDSIATLGYVGHGHGIRYEYGLFKQRIFDGYQVEHPDNWLRNGFVWEVAKPEESENIRFGGTAERIDTENGPVFRHDGYQYVRAVPHDVPIVGYKSTVVNTLRLWSADISDDDEIDMASFNKGDYMSAIAEKELAEVISRVLYPADEHEQGKMLRLKQQYFFVSAALQNMIRKYKTTGLSLYEFHEHTCIHMNDTHPTLAVPELMRLFMEEGMTWDDAWSVATRTLAYTNHTIMSEALEKWPVALFEKLLPNIFLIICEINERFCNQIWEKYPGDYDRLSEMSIIANKQVKMANMAIVASFSVNGVSGLHADILKAITFKDFNDFFPTKISGITNGVTHRRFLGKANPELANLLTECIGSDKWLTDATELKKFERFADDVEIQGRLAGIRYQNKKKMAEYMLWHNGVVVDPDSIFDVQIKRLHEYKRQLLNAMHIMYLYNHLRDNPNLPIYPRTFIFGAKAAPSYYAAKKIIKLINTLAARINNDKSIKDKLKVVFLENYRVSLAEKIIPASDLSEQISTAGKEASGTGNMKFMLNGALTIGTLDGANVEMHDCVGDENIYIFGLRANEVEALDKNRSAYNPKDIVANNPHLKRLMDQLWRGAHLQGEADDLFQDLYYSLLEAPNPDPYYHFADFDMYVKAQAQVSRDYANKKLWWRKAIVNIANAGYFSSDRTIEEYNSRIWGLPKHNF